MTRNAPGHTRSGAALNAVCCELVPELGRQNRDRFCRKPPPRLASFEGPQSPQERPLGFTFTSLWELTFGWSRKTSNHGGPLSRWGRLVPQARELPEEGGGADRGECRLPCRRFGGGLSRSRSVCVVMRTVIARGSPSGCLVAVGDESARPVAPMPVCRLARRRMPSRRCTTPSPTSATSATGTRPSSR